MTRLRGAGWLAVLIAAACAEQTELREREALDAGLAGATSAHHDPEPEPSRSPDASSGAGNGTRADASDGQAGGAVPQRPDASADSGVPEPIDAAPHSSPDAAHSSPDAAHSSPDAAHESPDAAHSSPDAAHESPDATSADAETRDAEPPSPTAVYTANRWSGALEHVTIMKSDPATRHCLALVVAYPAEDPEQDGLELPPGWFGRVYAMAAEADGSCRIGTDSSEWQPALAVRGRVTGRDVGSNGQLCSLDLDFEADFMPTARIPARDQFLVNNLVLHCE